MSIFLINLYHSDFLTKNPHGMCAYTLLLVRHYSSPYMAPQYLWLKPKMDSRTIDVGAGLITEHTAIRSDAAVRIISARAAVHTAVRANVTVEIGYIAVHIGRVNIAANI